MAYRELIALAIVLAAGSAMADNGPADPTAAQIDRRLADRLVRLAEHHYRVGEYYRAISAYEELAVFAADDETRRYAAIRIAMSYHHGHQLDEAVAAYREALALVHDPDTARALRIQLALARVERGFDQPGAEALDAIAAELAPSTASGTAPSTASIAAPGDRTLALYHLARIDALAGRRDAALGAAAELRTACRPAPSTSPSLSLGCASEPLLSRALDQPPVARRSPWLGVALSLVVPGSGSVYGGHLVDGLYYVAFTSLSGLGALDVYQTDRRWTEQRAAFYGLAALTAILYAGSAVQGYVSVARANALAELDARTTLWRTTELPWPLEPPGLPGTDTER